MVGPWRPDTIGPPKVHVRGPVVIIVNQDTTEREEEIGTEDIHMSVILSQLERGSFTAELEHIHLLNGGVFPKQCINAL
jgi:hypothetical protein